MRRIGMTVAERTIPRLLLAGMPLKGVGKQENRSQRRIRHRNFGMLFVPSQGWCTEEPRVRAAELRRAFVPDLERDAGCIETLVQH